MLRRLFELEVPEVYNGAVELKSIAREAGYRSKVAVAAHQEGIDPVGCCVGLRGIRIQNIVNELNGEKIDVVMWSPDISVFITKALSPAQVLTVKLGGEQEAATAIVPDKQLSLAIGKEGQNVRLAVKLTGWRIDIKSASEAEAERVAEAKPVTTEIEEAAIVGELPVEVPTAVEPALAPGETPEEAAEPVPAVEATFTPPVPFEPQVTTEKVHLRFAEDILVPTPIKPGAKSRSRKKKGVQDRGGAEDGIKIKKLRRASEPIETDEEY
jgi:N utilization substance protein A